GKFTISPVTTPYDVVVADVDPSAQHDIVEWVGLTTRTPTLQDGYAGTYRQSAAVTGNLTGVTFPGAATSSVAVFFDSARGYHYAGSHIAGNQIPSGGAWGAANVQGIWFGGATQTGTVYTLYWS